MATQIVGRGTVLQVSISASYTTIDEVFDFSFSGSGVGFYNARSFGSGVGTPKNLTTTAEGGQASWNQFYDPLDSTHQHLTDNITTPAKESMKLILTDASSTEITWTGLTTGGPEMSVDMEDGTKTGFTQEIDGLPVWPT